MISFPSFPSVNLACFSDVRAIKILAASTGKLNQLPGDYYGHNILFQCPAPLNMQYQVLYLGMYSVCIIPGIRHVCLNHSNIIVAFCCSYGW